MEKWPKIAQYANVVKLIKEDAEHRGMPIPVVEYEGSVKLHGTNGSFYVDIKTGELIVQSRNRIITPNSDNNGFAFFVHSHEEEVRKLCARAQTLNGKIQAIIYGEWCGAGINQGCAIHQEKEKFFVIFGVKQKINEDDHYYETLGEFAVLSHKPSRIYNIAHFQRYNLIIDFTKPADVTPILAALTDKVENMCPVGKAFGHEGIGEGIVWRPVNPMMSSDYWFKTKGEKHSVTKVKSVKSIGANLEKIQSAVEFAKAVVTEPRLLQGIEYLKEMEKPLDRSSTGAYLKWFIDDVVSEEMDLMKASDLEPNEVSKQVSTRAREWYFEKIGSLC